MPKKLLHGIDITAPGGVQKLLDFHRLTFGGAVMEDDPGAGTAPAGEPNDQGSTYTPPATQADLDRIIGDRVARERGKYADYDDLKAKAAQVDGFQSRITELETTNGELTGKIQTFEQEKERAKLVSDVATAKGVPASALRGSTKEELEAHADQLAELLKPSGPVIPNQERIPDSPDNKPSEETTFVRGLFSGE
ncbi:scaffolding protein [Arthrobacter phage AbbyDaisy]|nr:scaffolding protein [Arthrobacter phage AbbyDaisy]